MRSSFNNVLLAIVAVAAISSFVGVRVDDAIRPLSVTSVTRVDDLEIVGDTDATGVVTARAGVRLTTLTTGPILLSGAGDPNGATNATQGSLYLRTSNATLYTNTDGAMAWTAVGASSSAGLFSPVMSAVPTAASTGFGTWWYQFVGSTYADGELGPLVTVPVNGGATRFTALAKTAPATPYTITMLVGGTFPLSAATSSVVYCGWGEAATGAANKGDFVLQYPNQTVQLYRFLMTNATTLSSNPALNATSLSYPPLLWWRISDDGTTATIAWSSTGDDASFITVYSVTKAGSFLGASGYNYVLFGCSTNGGGSGNCQILSYEES